MQSCFVFHLFSFLPCHDLVGPQTEGFTLNYWQWFSPCNPSQNRWNLLAQAWNWRLAQTYLSLRGSFARMVWSSNCDLLFFIVPSFVQCLASFLCYFWASCLDSVDCTTICDSLFKAGFGAFTNLNSAAAGSQFVILSVRYRGNSVCYNSRKWFVSLNCLRSPSFWSSRPGSCFGNSPSLTVHQYSHALLLWGLAILARKSSGLLGDFSTFESWPSESALRMTAGHFFEIPLVIYSAIGFATDQSLN